MNLHFFIFEKFTVDFIKNINSSFEESKNFFVVFVSDKKEEDVLKEIGCSNILIERKSKRLSRAVEDCIGRANKIFLHPLVCLGLRNTLRLVTLKGKKVYWVIWGIELYEYQNRFKSIPSIIKHFARLFIIRRLSGIIYDVEGEYLLAKKWYKTRAPYFSAGYLPDFSFVGTETSGKDKSKTRILVSHSANDSNRHFDTFKKLEELNLDLERTEIIVPLSYSERKPGYVDSVIAKGKELFGTSFIPITKYMSVKDYNDILKTIDIALFGAQRQIATINIELLLVYGAKVFIRDDITSWNHFIGLGCKIFSYNSSFPAEKTEFKNPLTEEQKKRNREIILKKYSLETFKKEWAEVLDL